jgi:hypothetical protein
MSGLTNVLFVKQTVDEVIHLLEIMIEEHGTNGEIELAEALSKDQEYFAKQSLELGKLANSDIMTVFLVKAIKEHLPDLDVDLLNSYVKVLSARKLNKIHNLQEQVEKHLEFSKVLQGHLDEIEEEEQQINTEWANDR